MNRFHRWLCRSALWRTTLKSRIPWVVSNADLGPEVLELGPGPGLTTEVVRTMTRRLTVIELDAALATGLVRRFGGTNVEVVKGDASKMPFDDARFSAVVSFTMLHHIPSPFLQDQVFREACRVVAPGGSFVGSDSLPSLQMRLLHIGDTLVLVSPDTLARRLEAAGFRVVAIERRGPAFRFHAVRPAAESRDVSTGVQR